MHALEYAGDCWGAGVEWWWVVMRGWVYLYEFVGDDAVIVTVVHGWCVWCVK